MISSTPANDIDEHTVPLLKKMAAICAPFLNQSYITQDLLNSPLPESALLRQFAPLGLIGKSAQFVELLRSVETAARSNARVLLEGQSGTGKERIAKAIHHFSSRKNRPFVTIDCGAIPEHLLESELFGHVRGAFTGATQDRIGLIEEARHGTLFLDEMTNLPLNVQAKFLRFLQEGEIRAVGSNLPRKVDIRIIAAASTPLKKLVETGKFREDLFYRLHVLPIYVPTLFERQEDIPHLARHFLKKIAAEQNKPLHDFDSSLMRILQQQKWPGNIRELENFIERLVTLLPSNSTTLTLDSVPHQLKKELKHNLVDDTEQITGSSLHESLYALEEKLIRKALTDHNWNQSRAARALRVSEYTIRYKMEKYGIVKPYKLQSHRSQPD